jgi:hypothetical protein
VEAHAPIGHHRQQVKEDAASAKLSASGREADAETDRRHDDLELERDHSTGDRFSNWREWHMLVPVP